MGHVAIIGGSGVYNIDAVKVISEHEVNTPFGKSSGKILELEIVGAKCFFLPRHGVGHKINPSEINYRANIYALKTLGVDTVVSVSAVGSLREEYEPTHFVLPKQFIDWTKGQRARTFFENGSVGHVSNAYPIHSELHDRLDRSLQKTEVTHHVGGTYICIEGPQFSTRAESDLYRSFNCDIIGMTNVPEAFLAKEAGMAYATVGMVTDYDCWKEEHCTVDEIMKVMSANYNSVQAMLDVLVPELVSNPITVNPENKYSVVTNPELISEEQKKIIQVLIG
jgi:5'-methylthioadenosine phosphorylase